MSLAADVPGVTVRVPAKVNLELSVGGRRADGYHELATVFHAVGLYDEVIAEPAADWSVEVLGAYAARAPTDESNLALRAAGALARHAGLDTAVALTIDKDIPVAGGLAGGSADAAAALVACDALWGLDLPRGELEEIAADLGADVPFLLHGGTAIGSGFGEQVVPVLARGHYQWVFAVSEGGLSTPEVYAECDRLRGDETVPGPKPSEGLMAALRAGEPHALGAALANDLQEAAFSLRPGLAEVVRAGNALGALGAVVCGSGPTVAFLVESSPAALDLAVGLAAQGVAPEIKRAPGPVPGAHVLSMPSGFVG